MVGKLLDRLLSEIQGASAGSIENWSGKTRLTIYKVSTPEEARSISEIGIDHIGILVGKGEFPRELRLETAAEIAAAVRAPSKVSALFLTADISLIEEWAR